MQVTAETQNTTITPPLVSSAESQSNELFHNYFTNLCKARNIKTKKSDFTLIDKMSSIQEINKYFFETVLDKRVKESAALDSEDIFFIDNTSSSSRQTLLDSLTKQINTARDNANYYTNEVLKHCNIIANKSLEYEGVISKAETPKTFIDMINKILESPFFEFDEKKSRDESLSYGQKIFSFITKECFLSYKNDTAGIDIKDVSLGRFRVNLNTVSGNIRILSYSLTTAISGHIHPHISNDSLLCWGNAKEVYSKALQDRDFAKLFPIIETILKNYNPASPYVALVRWDILKNPTKYKAEYKEYSTRGLCTDYSFISQKTLDIFKLGNSVVRFYAELKNGCSTFEEGNVPEREDIPESVNTDYINEILQYCFDEGYRFDELIFRTYRLYRGGVLNSDTNYIRVGGEYIPFSNLLLKLKESSI